jgi:hypothetical protein
MARYLRIRSIVRTKRTGEHERIKWICGLTRDGSHWTLTHEDAVSQVENGICAFYTEGPQDERYDVIVAMDVHAHRYLKTVADTDQPDQLLFLPECPRVVHTSRRFTPRVETHDGVFVDWCCFGLEDISRVRNLSLDGLFVETAKSRSMGSTVKLEFLVQEGQIRADAVVKRAEPGSGLAMKFTTVTEQDRPRLGALINRFRYSS